jgi:hypothetical protein
MTSANQGPEKEQINQSENNEDVQENKTEVSLDPNPSKALTELATGNETTTPADDSSSKNV